MTTRTIETVVDEGGRVVIEPCPDGYRLHRDFSKWGFACDTAQGASIEEACGKLTMSRRGPDLQASNATGDEE